MLLERSLRGTPSSSRFTSFAYATTPPSTTSLEPGTDVSRAATRPPVHDSAVASVKPALAAELEHVLLDRHARRGAKSHRSSGGRSAASSASARSSAPGLDDEVDVDLEVARADRRPRRRRRRRPRRRARARPRTRSTPKKRRTRRLGGCVRARSARSASVSSAFGHSRCSSDGGPGRTTTTTAAVSRIEARRGPCEPERARAVGHRRLLRDAGCEVRVVAAQPLARRARDTPSIRASSSGSTCSPTPSSARDELDRAVVVRRPEPARESTASPSSNAARSAASSSAGSSPTIAIRAGSRPSRSASRARNGPLRSVRSPRTSSLPVTTMTARGRLNRRRVPSSPERRRAGCDVRAA